MFIEKSPIAGGSAPRPPMPPAAGGYAPDSHIGPFSLMDIDMITPTTIYDVVHYVQNDILKPSVIWQK